MLRYSQFGKDKLESGFYWGHSDTKGYFAALSFNCMFFAGRHQVGSIFNVFGTPKK